VTASSPFSLAGSVAAVVGTSANIGTGIALQLAAAGARVACIDKDAAMAKRAADEIHGAGGHAMAVTCDVTSEPDVVHALAALAAELGLVDVLVNGPVVYLEKGIRQMSLAEWRMQLSVLLDGAFLFTKHVAEALIEAGRPGAVINLVSTAGHQGEPGNIGYTTAKGGIVNMTRAAAMDLAPYGIRVNSLTPTATDPREGIERGRRWGVTGVTDAHVAALARRGIVGRFVLADVARWREGTGHPIDQAGGEPVPVSDVAAALAAQGCAAELGDILLIRFGWTSWYGALDQPSRAGDGRAGLVLQGHRTGAGESHRPVALGLRCRGGGTRQPCPGSLPLRPGRHEPAQ